MRYKEGRQSSKNIITATEEERTSYVCLSAGRSSGCAIALGLSDQSAQLCSTSQVVQMEDLATGI
jgi:hypothetical protein